MASLKKQRVDPDKRSNGVWFEWNDGIELRIAKMGNPKFEEFIAERQRARLSKLVGDRQPKLTDEEAEQMYREAVAHTILLEWRNVEDMGPYTPELGLQLFNDPEYDELYKFVVRAANRDPMFLKKFVEDAAKN